MPAHDWTKVVPGVFHDFHSSWIAAFLRTLNSGVLPSDLYARAEQGATQFDSESLPRHIDLYREPREFIPGGGTAVATARPKAHVIGKVDEAALYALKRRTLTIRHATNDRIVALLEIASPGNKDRVQSVQRFVDKAVAALQSGYHLVVIDLFPAGPSDPAGLGSAIWEAVGGQRIDWPVGKPLTAAAFQVADLVYCYGESFSSGEPVPEMPLFYEPDWYVNLPLDSTYNAAYEGVPRRLKKVIEAVA